MAELIWDADGARKYETGVDRGVLYIPDGAGAYTTGVPWNGLVSVSEAPSGAEANPQYADNFKYLNLYSAEEFGATIEAFTYPDEFAQFDGIAEPKTGVYVGQQSRGTFGLSYRTKIGNDIDGDDHGYKLHLVYGCSASPSEKAYTTINDSPEAITFSWEVTTTPVAVTGLKRTAIITIDSTKVSQTDWTELTNLLWGSGGGSAQLPSADTVIGLFNVSAQTSVIATAPTFVSGTGVITIVATTGVRYYRADTGATVNAGPMTAIPAASTLVIRAEALNSTYVLDPLSDDSWSFTRP